MVPEEGGARGAVLFRALPLPCARAAPALCTRCPPLCTRPHLLWTLCVLAATPLSAHAALPHSLHMLHRFLRALPSSLRALPPLLSASDSMRVLASCYPPLCACCPAPWRAALLSARVLPFLLNYMPQVPPDHVRTECAKRVVPNNAGLSHAIEFWQTHYPQPPRTTASDRGTRLCQEQHN